MPKFLAIVVLIAGIGPGELPEYLPAGDQAYTLDLELDGYVNGRMDPDRLLTIRGCTLERDAAYTYSLMFEAAEQDGIRLRPGDCYRTYAQQDRAYNSRCPVETVPVYSTSVSGGRCSGISRVRGEPARRWGTGRPRSAMPRTGDRICWRGPL